MSITSQPLVLQTVARTGHKKFLVGRILPIRKFLPIAYTALLFISVFLTDITGWLAGRSSSCHFPAGWSPACSHSLTALIAHGIRVVHEVNSMVYLLVIEWSGLNAKALLLLLL